MFKRASLLLALGVLACNGRVPSGGTTLAHREFEIKNGAPEAICAIEIRSIQAVDPKANRTIKVDIKAGATETMTIDISHDHERQMIFKACDGKVLKEWAVQLQPTPAHVDVP